MSDDDVSRMNARIGAYASSSDGTENLGIDWFEHLQLPMVHTHNDPLATFVMARVRELETEPRGEIKTAYDQAAGPMAHRYAKHVRRDCIVFRHIVLLYLEFLGDVDAGAVAEDALLAVANRWSDHREFRDEWRRT